MNRLRAILLTLGLISLALGGCANVQPWQHAALANNKMNRDRDPIKTASDEHVYFSREAATGGRGVGGAGCGCN
jgi:hypothetical protein